jgi:arylamine N-acetyltransferase
VSLTTAGPAAPIPLVDGIEVPWGSTNDRKRLIWSSIPEFENPEKCWILQHKREGNEEWDGIYCFAEVQCLPQDIEVMNWKSTKNVRGSFFNQMILCVRTVMEEEDVVGVITMADGKVKQRIRGNTETLVECVSEVERRDALEKWFDIVLGEQERLGIRGLSTELKGALESDRGI